MPYQVIFTDELYHHGVKGQKWGVRRFRKKDNSLTEEGKDRYSKKRKIAKKVAIGAGIAGAGALTLYGAHKYRQHIRNKAAKRQVEIGKRTVSEALLNKYQADRNYNFLKDAGDIKGALKEKQKSHHYNYVMRKASKQYPKKANKLKNGKYKDAKNFLLVNSKPSDYIEKFAIGGAVGAPIGIVAGRQISKRRRQKRK